MLVTYSLFVVVVVLIVVLSVFVVVCVFVALLCHVLVVDEASLAFGVTPAKDSLYQEGEQNTSLFLALNV